MVRKVLLTLVLAGLMVAAAPAGADTATEGGAVLIGRGPCYTCSEQESRLSAVSMEIPAGAAWELRYEPALPGNVLHAYVRLGEPAFGVPDVLVVYGEPGTLAQPFEVVFTN